MLAVHTWRETYRANPRLARTSCPTVYGSLVHFATGAFRGRRRALSCLENLFQIVCQCTFALDERSAARTVGFFIDFVCRPSASLGRSTKLASFTLRTPVGNSPRSSGVAKVGPLKIILDLERFSGRVRQLLLNSEYRHVD